MVLGKLTYSGVFGYTCGSSINKLELVYLPVGKYCVYPRMVYRQAVA